MIEPPDTLGPAIRLACIITPIWSFCFICLRMFTRLYIARAFGYDDACAILTMVLFIAYSSTLAQATKHGLGWHEEEKNKELNEEYYLWIYIISQPYLVCLIAFKMTLLLSYYRIFSVSRKFAIACLISMAFVVGYLGCNILTQLFSCRPIKKFWMRDVPGTCIDTRAAAQTYGFLNVVSDLLIAILPLRMVWTLRMNKKEKWAVSTIFIFGVFAFAVALTRWIFSILDFHSKDQFYVSGYTWIFSLIEIAIGITCGCTMTLKPFVRFCRDGTSAIATKSFSGRGSTRFGSTSENKSVQGRWLNASSRRKKDHDTLGSVMGTDTGLGNRTSVTGPGDVEHGLGPEKRVESSNGSDDVEKVKQFADREKGAEN